MIRKIPTGWEVDYYPQGRSGPRIRKRGFKTRIQAANYLRRLERGEATGRRLSTFVQLWYDLHGHSLKDAKYRLTRTMAICERLGNPDVSDLTASDWAEYRRKRLVQVTPSTVNHEQRYLSAVLAELVRLGHLKANPLQTVRQLRQSEPELTFLSLDQCRTLLEECRSSSNPHCYPVALLCLATGARWAEAETLSRSCLVHGKVIYRETKTNKNRAVPVSAEVLAQIDALSLPGPGRLFRSCRSAFRSAYGRTGFETPQQLTHILRHTFASHYMMAGGDILSLQRILGHGDIRMTMKYSHLSPDFLVTALTLNPIAQMGYVVEV